MATKPSNPNPFLADMMSSPPSMTATKPTVAPTGEFDAELTSIEDAVASIRDGDPANIGEELSALDAAVAALKQKAQPTTSVA